MTTTPGSSGRRLDPSSSTMTASDSLTVTDDRTRDASAGELLSNISRDLSTLMRQEIELAKAEAQESAKKSGKGAGMFAGAGLGGHFVLLFLSIALWWGLGDAIGHSLSALVVAGIWAVIAAILAAAGRSQFRQVKGMPQTADSVKQIPPAIKGDL